MDPTRTADAATECARLTCRRPLAPQHGPGRRRRFCSSTCRAAAHHEALHGVRCAVRVGTRSCPAPAAGFLINNATPARPSGRRDDADSPGQHPERIAACDTCRPAVESLLRRAAPASDAAIHWEPLPGTPPGPPAEPAWTAEPARPPAGYVPYGERRPYTVADSLDELTGPTVGVVTLPHHLDWSGSARYDLDTPGMLAELYKTVLLEAARVEDLRAWLDGERLRQLWPELYLPPKVRRLWEERFPELAAARTARAA